MKKKLLIQLFGAIFVPIFVLLYVVFRIAGNLDASIYIGSKKTFPTRAEPKENEMEIDVSILPRDKLLVEMEEIYTVLTNDIEKYQTAMDNVLEQYQISQKAVVCSEANRAFNDLEKNYNVFVDLYDEITSYFELYKECYNKMDSVVVLSPDNISKNISILDTRLEDMEKIDEMYLTAKQKADDMFEEYYDLMCHIVYAEAGERKCSTEERWYVANVIENRIKRSDYPNSIRDVIYDSGQYEPVYNGKINQTPSLAVRSEVEEYLRGHAETGMPDNVVFQSLFEQGSGIWKKMPSGHYFCYR